jgi:2-(1,2-epoxy-1,2-dihydrophenyl)acetyl-CoA isomerase
MEVTTLFSDLVIVQKNDHGHFSTGSLILNDAPTMNALSEKMVEQLCLGVELLERACVRVIVVKSSNHSFSAGGDIKAMQRREGMFAGDGFDLRKQYHNGIQKMSRTFEECEIPLVAVVNGAAVGAGCDLSCMCDIRLAGPNAMWSESFARLGLVPGDGGTFFLSRAIGYAKANYMLLTAAHIRTKKAYEMVLAHEMAETEEELASLTEQTVASIASLAPEALRLTKVALKMAYTHPNAPMQLQILAAFQGLAQKSSEHEHALQALSEKKPIHH